MQRNSAAIVGVFDKNVDMRDFLKKSSWLSGLAGRAFSPTA
jgi:hypothetical protein